MARFLGGVMSDAVTIPAKQLMLRGSKEMLGSKLINKEIGWCTDGDENALYGKTETGLVKLAGDIPITTIELDVPDNN